jgi:hypothetical protein
VREKAKEEEEEVVVVCVPLFYTLYSINQK